MVGSDLRWICPWCPGSNNSWRYDSSCPMCFRSRGCRPPGPENEDSHSRTQTGSVVRASEASQHPGDTPVSEHPVSSPFKQPSQHLSAVEVFTDSGYGSNGIPVKEFTDQTSTKPLPTIQQQEEPTDGSGDSPIEEVEEAEDDDSDARTEYSQTSSLALDETVLQNYINEFALSLYGSISSYLEDRPSDKIFSILPGLLETFALRGLHSSVPLQGKLMVFAHKHRQRINDRLKHEFSVQPEDDIRPRDSRNKIDLEENIHQWRIDVSDADGLEESQRSTEYFVVTDEEDLDFPDLDPDLPEDLDPGFSDLDSDLPDLESYRQILKDSSAYDWLVSRIRVESALEIPEQTEFGAQLKSTMHRAFGSTKSVRRSTRQTRHKATFTVKTDMLGFFRAQEYKGSPRDTLAKVICLVGSATRGQATTCQQYMAQVWPRTGPHLLKLFKRALESHGHEVQDDNCDGTHLSIVLSEHTIKVSAEGIVCCLEEIAEQTAWLASAIRFARWDLSPSNVSPRIESTDESTDMLSDYRQKSRNGVNNLDCEILLKERIVPGLRDTVGSCWQNLFRNPVLVTKYPIPRRPQAIRGVEMSLQMMALLCNTDQAMLWNGKVYIKGFCTMLVPTKVTEGMVTWHVLFNDNGEHISFADKRAEKLGDQYPDGLKVTDLELLRHVVGWCESVQNYIGSQTANYDIKWATLRQPGQHFAFERVTIAGGKFITGSVSIALGKKDRATHISHHSNHTDRMKWISKKFVILYDIGDKRAWLSNGLSVLLHLVRASLEHDAKSYFRDHFLFDPEDLQESSEPYAGLKAAIDVLLNLHNLSLPLYANPDETKGEEKFKPDGKREFSFTVTSTHSTLRDRVNRIYDLLEQIIAHQEQEDDEVGYKVKFGPRARLEGFNFKDIATLEDPFRPCYTKLQRAGRGWVDFTRAIHAITLSGTGFGNLIRPESNVTDNCRCLANSDVPTGQDYLTVGVPELEMLLEKRGSPIAGHWSLAHGISWHTPSLSFEKCRCKSYPSFRGHPHRVQVLLPDQPLGMFYTESQGPAVTHLPKNGAVLFGYTKRFPLSWPNFGRPERQEIRNDEPDDDNGEEEVEALHDSSVGTTTPHTTVKGASSDLAATSATSEPPQYMPGDKYYEPRTFYA